MPSLPTIIAKYNPSNDWGTNPPAVGLPTILTNLNPSLYQPFTASSLSTPAFFTVYGTALIEATSFYQNTYATSYSFLAPFSSVATVLGVWAGTFSALFGSSLLTSDNAAYTVYDNGANTYQFVYTNDILASSKLLYSTSAVVSVGSAYVNFVDALGSNVFSGLLDATNSIVTQQDNSVQSYYSASVSYQINIANLTAALNSVAGSENTGTGLIAVTSFLGMSTGVPQTSVYTMAVNSYLSLVGDATITNSSEAVTQIQSYITVQQNALSNQQTFLNSAVSTLQSQISLAGQIIQSLSAAVQAVAGNIR